MNKIIFFSIVGIIVFMIFVAFLILVILMIKNALDGPDENIITRIFRGDKMSIKEINNYLVKNAPSKDDLNVISGYVVGNYAFPAKANGKVPDSAKPYLDFVSLFAASPNSDAKLISTFNRDIKAKNPEYSAEIDSIETKGIKARK